MPSERFHLVSPFGPGLHIDRQALGRVFWQAASGAGVEIRFGEAITGVDSRGWKKSVALASGTVVESQHVVLAFGRSTSPSSLSYRRIPIANFVAVGGMFASDSGVDHRTMIEAVPEGWFYAVEIPFERRVIMLITLANLVPSELHRRLEWWKSCVARTRLICEAIDPTKMPLTISTFDARQSVADFTLGDDWFAIGDARFAPDPLSGQGMLWAIDDAKFVSEQLLAERGNAVQRELRQRTMTDLTMHGVAARKVYRSEIRFRSDPFWQTIHDCSTSGHRFDLPR